MMTEHIRGEKCSEGNASQVVKTEVIFIGHFFRRSATVEISTTLKYQPANSSS